MIHAQPTSKSGHNELMGNAVTCRMQLVKFAPACGAGNKLDICDKEKVKRATNFCYEVIFSPLMLTNISITTSNTHLHVHSYTKQMTVWCG